MKKQIRVAALWYEGMGGVVRTKVIFRDEDGKEYAYWMGRQVYDSIPLGVEATPDDYRKFGIVNEALDTDIYSLK